MIRYFAFAWDGNNPAKRAVADALHARIDTLMPSFKRVCAHNGLTVFVADERPAAVEVYAVGPSGGAILGNLFTRKLSARTATTSVQLDIETAEKIISSRGHLLIEGFWGRYVAFLRDDARNASYVVRDPTGRIPCFQAKFDDLDVFFSCAEDCVKLDITRFKVNWPQVRAMAAGGVRHTRETGLSEVFRVLPGECVELGSSVENMRSFAWDPARIASSNPIYSIETAVDQARETVQGCVNAWASLHQSIIHRTSGGLDSSLVLQCLKRVPTNPMVRCINYYDDSAAGDERPFARIAAHSAGCEILERERDAKRGAVRLESCVDVSRSPVPAHYVAWCLRSRDEDILAKEDNAGIFDGVFGDALFRGSALHAATDFVFHHGLGLGLFAVTLDAAVHNGESFWTSFLSAIRCGKQRRVDVSRVNNSAREFFVERDVIDDLRTRSGRNEILPWSDREDSLPVGKIEHMKGLYSSAEWIDPSFSAGTIDRIQPLMSQPLIELFLRIPTYVLNTQGEERAVARRAFAAQLPKELLSRRTKGSTNEFRVNVFRRSESFARALFMEGVLVQERILNRERVERALSSPATSAMLMNEYANLEIWLQSWVRRGPLACAA